MTFSISVEGRKAVDAENITITKRRQVTLPLEIGNTVKALISDLILDDYTINHVNVFELSDNNAVNAGPWP